MKVCKGYQGRAWNRTALLVVSHCYLWQEFINSCLWLSASTSDNTGYISITYPPTKERSGSYINSIFLLLFLNFYCKENDIARSLFITSGSPVHFDCVIVFEVLKCGTSHKGGAHAQR